MILIALLVASTAAPDVPAIGRIFNLRVGVDTIEMMERRLGKGEPFTGGHPHGGRSWIDPRTGWTISAAGFEYSPDRGRIIDSGVSLESDSYFGGPDAKKADYGVYSRFKPGMSRAQVKKALAGLHGEWVGDAFCQAGNADVRHATNPYVDHLQTWLATFEYGDDGNPGPYSAKGLHKIMLAAK